MAIEQLPASGRPRLRLDAAAILLAGTGLFAYTMSRAVRLGFTHDESLTFNWFVILPWREIVETAGATANNHLLNSLLMRLSATMFGPTEIALRMPNVLAHLLFMTASYLIVRRVESRWMRVGAFLLVNLAPFQLDFFSLARGYGLALAFLMMATALLVRALEKEFAPGSVLAAALFGALAVLSNMSFAIPYVALFLVGGLLLCARGLGRRGDTPGRPALRITLEVLPLAVISVVLLSYVAQVLARLREKEELYLGTETLWESLADLIRAGLYVENSPSWLVGAAGGALGAGALVALWVFVTEWRCKGWRETMLGAGVAFPVLVVGLAGILAARLLFGAPYPVARTWLAFLPLCGISVAFALDRLRRRGGGYRRAASGLMGAGVFLLALNFVSAANLTHTQCWRIEADTKKMMQDLVGICSRIGVPQDRPMGLGLHWIFEPTTNFYRLTWNLTWLAPTTRRGLRGNYDFWFVEPAEQPVLREMGLKVVKRYEVTGNVLAVRDAPE
jgi:hypothetical protein